MIGPRPVTDPRKELAEALVGAVECDTFYDQREAWVYTALAAARRLGLAAGIRRDPDLQDADDWPVAFIDLPTGQVSWHMPGYKAGWDGHDTEEKMRRALAYVETVT